MTSVDRPNNSTPFIAVICPRKSLRSIGVTSRSSEVQATNDGSRCSGLRFDTRSSRHYLGRNAFAVWNNKFLFENRARPQRQPGNVSAPGLHSETGSTAWRTHFSRRL